MLENTQIDAGMAQYVPHRASEGKDQTLITQSSGSTKSSVKFTQELCQG